MPAEVWAYGTISILSLAILAYQWWLGLLTREYWLASIEELGGPWGVALLAAVLLLAAITGPVGVLLMLVVGYVLRLLIELLL